MGVSGLLTIVLGAVTPGNMNRFIDDPTVTARLPPWTGFMSTLGLFGWALSAGASGAAALALAWRGSGRARFFAATAALLVVLFVDDAFLFHDDIAPDRIGIPENVILALIAVVLASWAWRFRRQLAASHVGVLAVAAAAFAASTALDVTQSYELEPLEEWLKLSGIIAVGGWALAAAAEALDTLGS